MLKLGCCGWGYFNVNAFLEEYRGINTDNTDWKEIYEHKIQAYADFFDLVEVNKTFYKLPQVRTARKWKNLAREVNEDFEFTVKVSRVITHKDRFASEKPVEKFGEVKEIAGALGSNLILFQTPPSFGPDQENLENIDRFFSQVDREDFKIVWEPRGDWEDNVNQVKQICEKQGLIHCTDPFKSLPALEKEISYSRLHGKPPGEEMYKYTFLDEDLTKLRDIVNKIDADEKYILWNNYNMYEDVKKFESLA